MLLLAYGRDARATLLLLGVFQEDVGFVVDFV